MNCKSLMVALLLTGCAVGSDEQEAGDGGLDEHRDGGLTSTDPDGGTPPGDPDAGEAADGGEEPDGGSPDAGAGYAAQVKPIFDTKCMGCHGSNAMGDLDLRGAASQTLINVPSKQHASMVLVDPGALESSYLWHKLTDNQVAAGGSGWPMPPGQALTAGELGTVEQWILGTCED
jgi:mono/diheme cytochrome c family protein